MLFLNEWEVEGREVRFNQGNTPVLGRGATYLGNLMRWTNSNSDGWPYWSKPCRAAKSLQELLYDDGYDRQDATEAELRKALVPIKAFLTRQGVEHETVLTDKARLFF